MFDLGTLTYILTKKTRSDVTMWSPGAVTGMTRRMNKSRQDIINRQCISVGPSASSEVANALGASKDKACNPQMNHEQTIFSPKSIKSRKYQII